MTRRLEDLQKYLVLKATVQLGKSRGKFILEHISRNVVFDGAIHSFKVYLKEEVLTSKS